MVVKLSKTSAQKWLSGVPIAYTVKCADGHELKNPAELAASLDQMSYETFLSYWWSKKRFQQRGYIIEDVTLAGRLSKCRAQKQAVKTVADHIRILSKSA